MWTIAQSRLLLVDFMIFASDRYEHARALVLRRSQLVPLLLRRSMPSVALAWIVIVVLGATARIATTVTPVLGLSDMAGLALPYVLIALAPVLGYALAARSFPHGTMTAQPEIRLSLYGRWHRLSVTDARAHPSFGPAGFMASLIIGLMLNVVVRSFEFLLAVPAMSLHAPGWGLTFLWVMTTDVVVMSFFYMICFVTALRTVPYFPRLLLFVWLLDIVAQLLIARQIGTLPDLPLQVAQALESLLYGNIQKVLISMFVWLPYLILSERVNVTYRQRLRMNQAGPHRASG